MKYLPGPAIAQASGSIGGQTFSRNRFGQYIRTRAIPTNPNSASQQAVRNIFQTLTTLWNSALTQVQRDAWILYASMVTVKDALGQDQHLSGFNHFIRTNCVALRPPYTRVDDGPTIFTLGETDDTIAATISTATQQISLAFDDTLDWLDEDGGGLQVQMSQPVNPSVRFIPPVFRLAAFVDGDAVTPPTSPETIDTPFAVALGQHVMVQCRILRADGRLSPPFRDTTTVVA